MVPGISYTIDLNVGVCRCKPDRRCAGNYGGAKAAAPVIARIIVPAESGRNHRLVKSPQTIFTNISAGISALMLLSKSAVGFASKTGYGFDRFVFFLFGGEIGGLAVPGIDLGAVGKGVVQAFDGFNELAF